MPLSSGCTIEMVNGAQCLWPPSGTERWRREIREGVAPEAEFKYGKKNGNKNDCKASAKTKAKSIDFLAESRRGGGGGGRVESSIGLKRFQLGRAQSAALAFD